jgi:hypothetical protein
MNKQEVFSYVLGALRKQGKPAMHQGICVLEALDGSRCAIGHLLKTFPGGDSLADIDGGTSVLIQIAACRNVALPAWFVEDPEFLYAMQSAHDESARSGDFRPSFEYSMQSLASRYKLNYSPT